MGDTRFLDGARFTSKKRGLMRAKIRFAIAALVAGLTLAPVAALAQDAPPANAAPTTTTQPPTAEPVGPSELQNFKLPGTVTRPAESRPATAPKPKPATSPVTGAATPTVRKVPPARQANTAGETTLPPTVTTKAATRAPRIQVAPAGPSRPSSTVTMHLPPVGDSPGDSASLRSSVPATAPAPVARVSTVPLPWLVAAAMLLVGAGVYFWRNRQRQAIAGGGAGHEPFEAPPPAAAPRPAAAAAPRPAPAAETDFDSLGLVSTRLRPWLEIAFRPTRCLIEDEQVTFEFEFGLFNSGSTPARAILVEASYFNAGESQDREIEQFFANPVGEGGRAVSLAPLKRMIITSKVVTPRASIREFDAGGRKVFVPLIGFNALYRWAAGEGQTSASFILGRKTEGEKLAPFRLDMVDREFRALGNRPLPPALRL